MCLPLVEACKNIGHGFIPLHEKSVKYLTGYKMIAVEYCIRPRHFILIQDFSINWKSVQGVSFMLEKSVLLLAMT